MAASRRGQPPLSVRLPQPSPGLPADRPPISALFLIDFDVKAGYTIVWKQAVPGLELEGTVEYKSLPSGLHTVPDDLIYFVHDGGHAGLSAFVNTPTDEEETRHARMIAVGVLVPLSYGRLGRAWRHAGGLKEMAAKLAADRKQTQLLDDYWERNGVRETTVLQPLRDTPLESPVFNMKPIRPALGRGHARNRSASDGNALIPPGHRLSPFHPAWSLTALLDTFGPLIFPIHRAALLRKRILISCHAPVHEVCNFVYDISVLSNIPLSVCDVIDPAAPVQRLRPLFTVGVHDISYLLEHQATLKRSAQGNGGDLDRDDPDSNLADDAGAGWVACTTDSILAMKDGLFDMLITMPPPYASHARQRVWPAVECPKGVPVRATQRDLRRFRALRSGLARLAPAGSSHHASQSRVPQPPQQQQSQQQRRQPSGDGSSSSSSSNPRLNSPRSEASDTPTTPAADIRLSRTTAQPSQPSSSSSTPHHPATQPQPQQQQPRPRTASGATRTSTTVTTAAAANADDDAAAESIVEPTTWAALAYNGFMWWASAGEKRHGDEADEMSRDAALLAGCGVGGVGSPVMGMDPAAGRRRGSFGVGGVGGRKGSGTGTGTGTGGDVDGAGGEQHQQERDNQPEEDDDDDQDEEAQAQVELAVVTYFHRLTTGVLSVLADIVDSTDEDDLIGVDDDDDDYEDNDTDAEGEYDGPAAALGGGGAARNGGGDEQARLLGLGRNLGRIRVDSEALGEMGLDVWSQADADFVREVAARYFSRRAYVETKGVEVCGVRVC